VEKTIIGLEELRKEAERLVASLTPGTTATLVTLSGELGAGKTTFAQAIARTLGVTDAVTSPTFVLEKIYELPVTVLFKRLVHIDAYRLEQAEDLKALGFEEVVRDSRNLIVLEWPERVEGGLPEATISITLTANPDGSRTMQYV